MILGICTGQVYITLNVFIIVLEACLKLRADLTNIPTSGRASQLGHPKDTTWINVVSLAILKNLSVGGNPTGCNLEAPQKNF